MIELAPPERTDEIISYVSARTGVHSPVGSVQALGFVEDGRIVAGWMFERYTGVTGSVHVHWAVKPGTKLMKWMLHTLAIYIFDQLGVGTLYGEVRKSDTRGRDAVLRLGFRKRTVLPGYFPGDDLVIYSLDKNDCVWLPIEYKEPADGQEVIAATGS